MKANPNALELPFSVEQEYFDEELKELLDFVRENVGALVRVHWKEFSSAVHGVAWNGTKRNGVNPKTVMERLGHKNIETTLQTYTFNTEVMQQTAVDVFEKALAL